jgi:hypothetical protein
LVSRVQRLVSIKRYCNFFQCKYFEKNNSNSTEHISKVISNLKPFRQIDLRTFYQILSSDDFAPAFMINETELLVTNSRFPKNLLISGKDLLLFHQASLTVLQNDNLS